MFDLNSIIRPNIRELTPYRSARDDFHGAARVFLDANENPFGDGLNRYPDPHHRQIKQLISDYRGVEPGRIFCGNGSDEVIDLLYRAFCEPHSDSVVLCPPTYGMYSVSARINAVNILEVPLNDDFQLDLSSITSTLEAETPKLIFICSPNNPTGNSMQREDILSIAKTFNGLVIIDEAYIDFSNKPSLVDAVDDYPNLVIMQTFSKAPGLAGIRVGMAFGAPELISILESIKPPYNINSLSQDRAIQHLKSRAEKLPQIDRIIRERNRLAGELKKIGSCHHIYPSDANFLLVRFADPVATYTSLLKKGIVVRDRSNLIPGCLRITVGTPEENNLLIATLKEIS